MRSTPRIHASSTDTGDFALIAALPNAQIYSLADGTYGAGILLVPDYCNPVRDERVVRPAKRRPEGRRARI